MISSIETIQYGKELIEFEPLREDRKTFAIEVMPTAKIKVKAPEIKNKSEVIKKFKKGQNEFQNKDAILWIITKSFKKRSM